MGSTSGPYIMATSLKAPSVLRLTAALMKANYYYVYVFSVAWSIITGRAQGTTTAYVISLSCATHIATVSYWFMWIKHGAIQKLVSKYLTCNSKVAPESSFANNLKSSLMITKKRALIFWILFLLFFYSILFNTITYAGGSYFRKGRHLVEQYLILYDNLSRFRRVLLKERSAAKSSPLISGDLGIQGESSKIFVNDHLTIQNKGLLVKVKKTAKERGFQYVWVKFCKIFVRKDDTSPILNIKTEKDLSKIV